MEVEVVPWVSNPHQISHPLPEHLSIAIHIWSFLSVCYSNKEREGLGGEVLGGIDGVSYHNHSEKPNQN